jgi:hypothetical protein
MFEVLRIGFVPPCLPTFTSTSEAINFGPGFRSPSPGFKQSEIHRPRTPHRRRGPGAVCGSLTLRAQYPPAPSTVAWHCWNVLNPQL